MERVIILIAALTAFVVATAVRPATANDLRIFGHWAVNSERDRFDEGHLRIVAMVPSEQGDEYGMGLRCLDRVVSLVLSGSFHAGDDYMIKFRADRHPIIVTAGKALSDQIMQVAMVGDMHKEILEADEYAFRVIGQTVLELYFRAAPGADRALPLVEKACANPSDHPDLTGKQPPAAREKGQLVDPAYVQRLIDRAEKDENNK